MNWLEAMAAISDTQEPEQTQVEAGKTQTARRPAQHRKRKTQDGAEWLTAEAVARRYGMTRMSLYTIRKSGDFPKGRILPGTKCPRWSLAALKKWEEAGKNVQ